MRKARALARLALVAVVGGVWVYSGGCDRPKPHEPVEPDEPKDYIVYTSDAYFHTVFGYHTLTRQIDSMYTPFSLRHGVTVSADGKRLYLASYDPVVVVDTDSLGFIAELPYEPDDPIAVSPDNQLVAIANGGLHILNTTDYSIVFRDSTPVIHCVFSSDSKRLYCAGKGSNFVYKVDLSDSTYTVSQKEFPDGMIRYIVPCPDESKWFLYLQFATFGFVFEVYDVLRDSIIFRNSLVPGYGQIAVTPDGKYAFYTNPGRSGTDPLAPPGFTIFDVDANKIDRVVSDIAFFSGSSELCNWVANPNSVAVTPDGRWLSILGGSLALRVLYLYDIQREQLVHREDWGGCSHIFTNLSVQNAK